MGSNGVCSFQEDGAVAPDARVWVGGKEYAADAVTGEAVVPFASTTRDGAVLVLGAADGAGAISRFTHRAEEYGLAAGARGVGLLAADRQTDSCDDGKEEQTDVCSKQGTDGCSNHGAYWLPTDRQVRAQASCKQCADRKHTRWQLQYTAVVR
jgi:hypothetical protein